MSLEHRHHARCSAAAAGAPFTFAGTERQYERARPFLIRRMALDLEIHMAERSLSGTASLDFERVTNERRELVLDAIGFQISRVTLDAGGGAAPARYHYDGNQLKLELPLRARRGVIGIEYRAQPKRGLYFVGQEGSVPEQIWSQCQDEDARHWFPCHDKPHVKMMTELRVSVPRGMTALSNGELVSSSTRKGASRWSYHYRLDHPHPSYLVTLVVGRFALIRDRDADVMGRKVPVYYYVPAGRRADAERSLGRTPHMIELFSTLTGVPYPFSRYSQAVVQDFFFGGMENTTATTLYEHVLLDERAAVDVSSHDLVAHELAHQWFGDYVTCRDWSHAWLNEGFATFFEHLEREDRLGRDEYEHGVAQDLESYLSEASGAYSRPIVCRDYAAPIELFDRHLYEKGGLVLHMLRRRLGDDVFFRGVRHYLERFGGGIAETGDLMRALEEVSGESLERFFDEWVFRPGHPALDVKVSWERGQLTVAVKQTQKVGDVALFALDVEIAVEEKGGKLRRIRKEVTAACDVIVVGLGERPGYVAFDPEFRLVGSLKLVAPADMLRAQLKRGSTARVRAQAARALATRDDPPTVRALAGALGSSNEAWMVRAECALALGRIRGDDSLHALLENVHVEHVKVRRAVAAALGAFRSDAVERELAPVARKDPSYLVVAEAARSLGRSRQRASLRTLLGLLKEESWADVVRGGALDGLAALREEEAVPRVLEHVRPGLPSRGRRAAILALARLADDRRSRQVIEDLLDDPDPHIRVTTASALLVLGDVRSRGPLAARLEHELDGRVRRRIKEVLRELERSDLAERRRLGDELEAVKGELTELKTRLAKLEAGRRGRQSDSEGEEPVGARTQRTRPRQKKR